MRRLTMLLVVLLVAALAGPDASAEESKWRYDPSNVLDLPALACRSENGSIIMDLPALKLVGGGVKPPATAARPVAGTATLSLHAEGAGTCTDGQANGQAQLAERSLDGTEFLVSLNLLVRVSATTLIATGVAPAVGARVLLVLDYAPDVKAARPPLIDATISLEPL